MLQDFQTIFVTSVTVSHVLGSLCVSLVCGLILSYFYRSSYNGTSYSVSYVHSLVAFAMITTIVIMVIGNNLARAFGLVGSMSIIRFRMAIKDTQDIVFIFFALAVGMASGVGLYTIAFVGTLFIGAVILILSKTGYAAQKKREYLLQFTFTSNVGNDAPYIPVMKKFCKKFKLVNIKSIGETETMELSYYITLKKKEAAKEFVQQVGHIEGMSNINFFYDEEWT